jgi:hypothetical protein
MSVTFTKSARVKNHRGVGLISGALAFGRLWYAEPNAVSNSTKDLLPAVVALCVDDKARLADPGQNWNATDAITDSTLPWKRLVWAAVGSDYHVVHYERGGIDHSFHILVAKLPRDEAKPKVIWSAVGVRSKITQRLLTRCETGNWMMV